MVKTTVGILCLWLIYISMGWGLRLIAIGQITDLTNAKIETGSIKVHLDGSVFIEDLVVRPHMARDHNSTILTAENVYGRFSVGSLLFLRPRLQELRATNFVFDARYDLDNQKWNTSSLEIEVIAGGSVPTIQLENGTLQYSKMSKGNVNIVAAVPVEATFAPAEQEDQGYRFDITTAQIPGGHGLSHLTGFWQPGKVTVSGGISSADLPAFEKVWMVYVLAADLTYDENNDFSLRVRMKDVISTDRPSGDDDNFQGQAFFGDLGLLAAIEKFFTRYRPTGRLDIEVEEARGNFTRLAESTMRGHIYCKDVSICDRRFPYPVGKIAGTINFTEKSFELVDLKGVHDDVAVVFTGRSEGVGPNHRSDIRLDSDNMALDNDLRAALNARQQKLWGEFSPTGRAVISFRSIKHSKDNLSARLTVYPQGGSMVYKGFPYPLNNVTGSLIFDRDGTIIPDMISEYDGRRIRLSGKVTGCDTNEPVYAVQVTSENIPLDSVLGDALRDDQQRLYRQLDMKGTVNGNISISGRGIGKNRVKVVTEANIENASMKVPFATKALGRPIGLTKVSGKAVISDGMIAIEHVDGMVDDIGVSIEGTIVPGAGPNEPSYDLAVISQHLDLSDKNIAKFVPESAQNVLDKLQFRGPVDVSMDLTDGGDEVDYEIAVRCLGNTTGSLESNAATGSGTAGSGWYSYPLRDIRGRLIVRSDQVVFEDITASGSEVAEAVEESPKTSLIRINGQASLANDTIDSGSFTISARDVLFDERLIRALPEGVREPYMSVQPAGRFHVDLEGLRVFRSSDGQRCVELSGMAKFNRCNLNIWPGISEMDAALQMKCLYRSGSQVMEGQVALSAKRLKIMGEELTGLNAEMYYDQQQRNWQTRNLTANCYGGQVTGKLEFKQSSEAPTQYELQVGLNDIDLSRFIKNWTETKAMAGTSEAPTGDASHLNADMPADLAASSTGKVCGSLCVAGEIGSTSENGKANGSRLGKCKLTIEQVKVGKLSPLAKMLCMLKFTQPQDYAFDQMLIDSYIKDDKVIFEHLDLSGQAIAFEGAGSMNLQDQDVDLVLFARGPRVASKKPSLFQSLGESLGSTVVRMEVTGNLLDPDVKTTTLPVIQQTIDFFSSKPTEVDQLN